MEVKQAAVHEPLVEPAVQASPELLVELSRDPDPQLRALSCVVPMEGQEQASAAELWGRQAPNLRRTRCKEQDASVKDSVNDSVNEKPCYSKVHFMFI